MNIEEMVSLFGIYIGDESKNEFPPEIRALLLNNAQNTTIGLLNRQALEPLDKRALKQVMDGSGIFDLDSFAADSKVFDGNKGLDGIKLYGTNKKFASLISFHEYRSLNDMLHIFTDEDPAYYLRGNKIYNLPWSDDDIPSGSIQDGVDYYVDGYAQVIYAGAPYVDGDTFLGVAGVTTYTTSGSGKVVEAKYIDIFYYRKPVQMLIDLNTPANNVDCEFTERIQRVITGMACETFINKSNVAAQAYKGALEDINRINVQYPMTDSIEYNKRWFTQPASDVDSFIDVSLKGYSA